MKNHFYVALSVVRTGCIVSWVVLVFNSEERGFIVKIMEQNTLQKDKVFCVDCKYYYVYNLCKKEALDSLSYITKRPYIANYINCSNKNSHGTCPDYVKKASFWSRVFSRKP